MHCLTTWKAGVLAACIFLFKLSARGAEPQEVKPFTLERWGEDSTVSLDEFRGAIVVLDFFAHWCAPCLPASSQIEQNIRQYYEQRGGNRAGYKVHCLSVNVDQAAPVRTRQFIRKAGLSLVAEDREGQLFKALGGTALPYIVVLEHIAEEERWVMRFARSGFEGALRLRALIDQIGTAPRAVAEEPLPAPDVSRSVEWDGDSMQSQDVDLWDFALSYRESRPRWDYSLSFSQSFLAIDYRPAAYERIGEAREITKNRTAGRLEAKWKAAPHLTGLLNTGGYDGFSDYRSLWLGEFYRQRFGGLPGYMEPKPHGFDLSPGVRWEYLPGSGFLQAGFSYQQDEVASAYDKPIGLPLERRTSRLETLAGRLSLENVIAPRLRSLLEMQMIDTTERNPRWAYQASLNWALAENWVARAVAAGSHESPGFHSWSAALSLEHDWNDTWYLGIFGRHYRDSGEFSQALPESTAAPELETWQVGASLRWQRARWGFKLAAGPYFSSYGAPSTTLNAFEELYRSRTWFAGQFALRYNF